MRLRTTLPQASFREEASALEEGGESRFSEFLNEAMASETLRVSFWNFLWTLGMEEGSLGVEAGPSDL